MPRLIEEISLPYTSDPRGFVLYLTGDTSAVRDTVYDLHIAALEPNAVRGNHYHNRDEFVYVLGGKGVCQIEVGDLSGNKERMILEHDPMLLRIPKNVTHAFKNTGPLTIYLVCFYTGEPDSDVPTTVERQIVIHGDS